MIETVKDYDPSKSLFKHIGYSVDYYLVSPAGSKFIGYKTMDEPDREVFGYAGRKRSVLEEDIVLNNKKVIKKGSEVITELSPMVGRSTVKIFGAKSTKDM